MLKKRIKEAWNTNKTLEQRLAEVRLAQIFVGYFYGTDL